MITRFKTTRQFAVALLGQCCLALAGTGAFADDPANPTSAQKAPQVQWPGCVSIFHGHNWGVDENFVTALKEANFGGAGATENQIPACRKAGLKAFVFAWPHESIAIAPKYKDDPTVLAFYMADRYVPGRWEEFAALEKDMYQGNPVKPAIFTTYALRGGVEEFVSNVRPRALEFYHYHWDANRAPHWRYRVLEQYRQESVKAGGVPLIEIVLVMSDPRKTRQTVYGSLAYGTRGFRWWGGAQFFDLSKKDARGIPQRTALGDDVLAINTAIKAYDPVFAKTHCVDVYHTAPLPEGTKATSASHWFQLEGEEVLAGVFEDKDKNSFLMLANRDAFKPHEAQLRFKEAVEVRRMDKASGRWTPVKAELGSSGQTLVKVPLEEGSGELLSITRPDKVLTRGSDPPRPPALPQ